MIEYRLLGPFEVVRDGRAIDLGGPKQRAVLAVLLLEPGRVVSTDRIVATVWGDDPPPRVAGGLQAYVSNLRRLLRGDDRTTAPIVRRAPGYLADVAADDIDVTRFVAEGDVASRALAATDWTRRPSTPEAALALVRGPLLSDFADEEWVRVAATSVAERRVACEQDLVTALLGADRVADALGITARLLAEQPLGERTCWLHLVALYRAGRPAQALDAYRAHARSLDDELGLEPGPALRDLQGAMLRQDPELAHWPRATAAPSTPTVVEPAPVVVPDAPVPPTTESIVGRARELVVVDAILAEARASGSRWLLFTGPAGIGKSRLAEESLTRWTAAGGRVARARCPDDEGLPAWWPIRQLLRELGAEPDDVLRVGADEDADSARYAAYDRLVDVLAAAARARPLLVLVDDVHWADAATLRFLTYLLQGLDVAGLALVLTARDEGGRDDLVRLREAAARRDTARELALPPLDSADVARLVADVQGEEFGAAEAHQLTERTGGNPFFVSEYARLPVEQRGTDAIPVAVRSVLQRRLGTLDAEVVQVLRAAAVIGEVLDVDLLGRVTRLDRDELADLLDVAADERIIVAAGGAYRFAHALLRDEALAGLTPARRQRVHLRVAEALADGVGSDVLASRATHLVAALPLAAAADALRACRAAADDAEITWQPDSAAHWWTVALTVFDQVPGGAASDRDDLVIAQVSALARAGRAQTVFDTLDAAMVDAARDGRTASVGRLAAVLLRTSGAWPWVAYGSDAGPLRARLAGLEAFVRSDPPAHVRLLAALAMGWAYDDQDHAHSLTAQALAQAEALDDADALADALLGRALSFSAITLRAEESIALLERLVALPHRLAQVDQVIADGLLFSARMCLGDAAAAAEHVRQGALGSDLMRLPVNRMQMRWAEAQLFQWHGSDLDAAADMYEHAFELHTRTEMYESASLDVAMFVLRWDQGRLAEFPEIGDTDPNILPWARAMVAVACGDPRAEELLAAELARPSPTLWTTVARVTMLGHAVADLGAHSLVAAARAHLEPYAPYVANIGQLGVTTPAALALARLCSLDGDIEAARRYLGTASALAARGASATSVLRCRLLKAQLDAAAGRPDATELQAIAGEAERRGLRGVARAAGSVDLAVGRST